MAKYVTSLTGDVDDFVRHVDGEILRTSASANAEDGADITVGDARMIVRVYERYSMSGGNRVSLQLSVLAVGDTLEVVAISSGGSQAVFLKLNTMGESAFLDKVVAAIESWRP